MFRSHQDISCDLCMTASSAHNERRTPCKLTEIRYCVIGAEWQSILGSVYQPPCLRWDSTSKMEQFGKHPPKKNQIRVLTGVKTLQNWHYLKDRHLKQIADRAREGLLGPAPGEPKKKRDRPPWSGKRKRQRSVLKFKRPADDDYADEDHDDDDHDDDDHADDDHADDKAVGDRPAVVDRDDNDHDLDEKNVLEATADPVNGEHLEPVDIDDNESDSALSDIFDTTEDEHDFDAAIVRAKTPAQAFARDLAIQYLRPLLQDVERRGITMDDQLNAADNTIMSLEDDVNSSHDALKTLQQQLQQVEAEEAGLEARNRALVKAAAKAGQATQKLMESLATRDRDIDGLRSNLVKKDAQIELLTETVSRKDGTIDLLQNRVERQDGVIDQFKEKVAKVNEGTNLLKNDVGKKDAEIEQLRAEVAAARACRQQADEVRESLEELTPKLLRYLGRQTASQ